MRITFYAHACFRLEGSGIAIITDPYNPDVAGFEPVGETADVVLMSSSTDRFHSHAAQVPGSPQVVDALGLGPDGLDVHGVHITAYPNRENKVTGADDNAMYAVTLDGVRLLHMGDAGIPPAPDQVEALRDQVDVLFALTGGPPTITLDNLDAFIQAVRPRIVIPMHYFHPRGVLKILPVDRFLDRYPASTITHHPTSVIDLLPADLPDPTRIVVLPQSR